MATTEMTVKITPNDKGNPPGKLADAELHFTGGPVGGEFLIVRKHSLLNELALR